MEYRELFDKAGFELTRILPTMSPFSIIEGMVSNACKIIIDDDGQYIIRAIDNKNRIIFHQ